MARRLVRFAVPTVAALCLACCSSAPARKQSIPQNSRDLSALLHQGDFISYSYAENMTNSFCVTSVVGDEIHSTGPLVIRASSVRNIEVTPQGCAQRASGLRSAGRVAGGLALTPFVIVCLAAGGCDMK
jgi:hypothetical protein